MQKKVLSAMVAAALVFAGVPASAANGLPTNTLPDWLAQHTPPSTAVSITTDGPASEIPEDPGFTDAVGHWAEDAIGRFHYLGILKTDASLFLPDQPITRGELAALLSHIMHYKTASDNAFDDVKGHIYKDAIQKLRAAGVMLGDEKNCALPDADVTREEAMVLIARAFGFTPGAGGDEDPAAALYTDDGQISDWAKGYIYAMTDAGYLQGDGGCFLPLDSLTRAEAVTVLHNMITTYIDKPGEYNYRPYVGLADFVIIASPDVTILNYDIGGSILLTEEVDPATIRLKTCRHYGNVYRYEAGTLVRYLKASSYIVAIDDSLPVSSYDADLFQKDTRGVMQYADPDRPYYMGVDISSWQGDVDWWALRQEGVYFAFIRAGYRGYETGKIQMDPNFHKNVQGALSAGIKVGVYFFSQALNAWEATEEARFVLDLIKPYNITFPVVYDWETINASTARTNNITTEDLCEAANAFCKKVRSAGYTPMMYSNKNVSLLYYDLGKVSDYDFWYAEYADAPSFYYDFQIWQYTDSTRLPSLPGMNLDLNISFVDYANLP